MSFDFAADPFVNLDVLMGEASAKGQQDANAMVLATVNQDLQPSARIVLYKGLVRGGLSFYTNYQGRKARDLAAHPKVGACFFWPTLERQVRIEGVAEKMTRPESEAYFRTRPRLSQLGAWASEQSEEIASSEVLQARLDEFDRKFQGVEIPCPEHWGGYRLVPSEFEFWFGRQGRLHERYVFARQGDGWRRFMRSP